VAVVAYVDGEAVEESYSCSGPHESPPSPGTVNYGDISTQGLRWIWFEKQDLYSGYRQSTGTVQEFLQPRPHRLSRTLHRVPDANVQVLTGTLCVCGVTTRQPDPELIFLSPHSQYEHGGTFVVVHAPPPRPSACGEHSAAT
jgi:hypothetical protein